MTVKDRRLKFRLDEAHSDHAFIVDGDGYDVAVLRRYSSKDTGPGGRPMTDAEWQALVDAVANQLSRKIA